MRIIGLGCLMLTPVWIQAGFRDTPNGCLRIFRAHPAQINAVLLAMRGDSGNLEQEKSFDYTWFRDTRMPVSEAECWEFDGATVKRVALLTQLAIPNGNEQ